MLSEAACRYIVAIYEQLPETTPNLLAKLMHVSRPTAFETIKKLEQLGLIEKHEHTYRLTNKGIETAEQIIRSHRILETLLYQAGVELEEACKCATRIQGIVAPDIVDKIDKYLGTPASCPHGRPIPREAKV